MLSANAAEQQDRSKVRIRAARVHGEVITLAVERIFSQLFILVQAIFATVFTL
jgi:hypothetical protein